ncbi:helix-turn-helix domain-containing protein [Clostridium sp. WILCCON 0269]|uniref:Helix-turn-helix domain-containing protein n=1 Tax=Candidatus Clostridium eludens TaxID=3381663 RepID=A0ABW8SMD5_9CLOT
MKRLSSLRKSHGMSQSDLAEKLGVTQQTVSKYENGSREPDAETLKLLSSIFNVSIDYLLDNSNKKEVDIEINIPKEYTDKYKVTSRDKKQYQEEMKKANEAFFLNDELNEDAKKEMLDLMSELFWKAKALNKRKPKK